MYILFWDIWAWFQLKITVVPLALYLLQYRVLHIGELPVLINFPGIWLSCAMLSLWPCHNRCWSQLTVKSTTKSTWAVGSKGGTAVTTVQADLQDLITISLPNSQITAKHCSHHILHWFSWLMSQGVQLRSACKPEPSPVIAQSLPYGNQKLQSFTSVNCRHSYLLHIPPFSTHYSRQHCMDTEMLLLFLTVWSTWLGILHALIFIWSKF